MHFRDRELSLTTFILYLLCTVILSLSIFALSKYPGQNYVYIIFTVISNALLYFGFRNKAIFIDTFIGIFFWLGFWLKLSVRVAFTAGLFHEAVGNFDGSGAAFDHALLVTSCGLFGLLVASVIREKLIFNYPSKIEGVAQKGLLIFYRSHRKLVLFGFLVIILAVSVSNIYLGIYQKGAIPRTTLPYGLAGVYKWLLLFGLASFSALILKFEFEISKKASYLVVILGLLEGFFSNVSLLSRGMILNTSALIFGLLRNMKYQLIKVSYKYVVTLFIIFAILFGTSVLSVNIMRSSSFMRSFMRSEVGPGLRDGFHEAKNMSLPLLLDRWVGIEGVMAVSSYPKRGWDLWREAWKEVYSDNSTSYYDVNLITSPYADLDTTKNHYITLPGILAFCYYPDSFIFLFGCMFLLGTIAAIIEVSVFKFGGGNVILCSLLAQVVAYRYAHFGYVPAQSYLLFGTLYLNLFIIYFADKFLLYWSKHKTTL